MEVYIWSAGFGQIITRLKILQNIAIMERETHHDSYEHIIDIPNDEDSSSGSSLDEGSSSSARSSLSSDEETSDESATSSCLWNSMELVITLVHIFAALVVLTLAKDARALLLTWLIGYTCGCIATLLTLSWRFRKSNQAGEYSPTRVLNGVMEYLRMGLECFFVVWLILGIVWICDGHSSPSDAPKLYRSCIVFIAFNCVLLCADSLGEGLLGAGLFFQGPSHDDRCCICLDKYGDGEDVIRKFECSHFFHLECIDNWIRIKATCPLCRSQVTRRGRDFVFFVFL